MYSHKYVGEEIPEQQLSSEFRGVGTRSRLVFLEYSTVLGNARYGLRITIRQSAKLARVTPGANISNCDSLSASDELNILDLKYLKITGGKLG